MAPSVRHRLIEAAYAQKMRPEEIQRGFEKMPQGLLDVSGSAITPEEMRVMQKEFIPPEYVSGPDMSAHEFRVLQDGARALGKNFKKLDGHAIEQLRAAMQFTDHPDEYYLGKNITEFNDAELEELRRRINTREDFANRYYSY